MNTSNQIKQYVNKSTVRERGQQLAAQFKQPQPVEYKIVCANDDQHIELRTQIIKAVNTEASELSRTERDLIYEYVLHSFESEQNAENWLEQLSNDIVVLAPSTVQGQSSSFERFRVWLLTSLLNIFTWLLRIIAVVLSPLVSKGSSTESGYQKGARIGLVIGAIFLVYTVFAFYEASQRAHKEFQQAHVERWKETSGTIATITPRLSEQSSRNRRTNGEYAYKDGRYYAYFYKVTYSYQVSGRTYTSNRLYFPSSIFGSTESGEVPFKPQLKPGQHITVWYDPLHPEIATLDKNIGGTLFRKTDEK